MPPKIKSTSALVPYNTPSQDFKLVAQSTTVREISVLSEGDDDKEKIAALAEQQQIQQRMEQSLQKNLSDLAKKFKTIASQNFQQQQQHYLNFLESVVNFSYSIIYYGSFEVVANNMTRFTESFLLKHQALLKQIRYAFEYYEILLQQAPPFTDAIVKKATIKDAASLEAMQQQMVGSFSRLLQYLEAYQILMHHHLSMPPIKTHLELFFNTARQLIHVQLKIIPVIEKLGATRPHFWVKFDYSTNTINYQDSIECVSKTLKTIKSQKIKDLLLYQSDKIDNFMLVIRFLAQQRELLSRDLLSATIIPPQLAEEIRSLSKNPALTYCKELEILIVPFLEELGLKSILSLLDAMLADTNYHSIYTIIFGYLYTDSQRELSKKLKVIDALQGSFNSSTVNEVGKFYEKLEARITRFEEITTLILRQELSHFSRNFAGILKFNESISEIIIINQKLSLILVLFINIYPLAIDDISEYQIALLELQLQLLKYLKSHGISCLVKWPILENNKLIILDKATISQSSSVKGELIVGFDLKDIIAKQNKLILLLRSSQLDRELGWDLSVTDYGAMMQRSQLKSDKNYQQLIKSETILSEAAAQKARLAKERDAKRRQEALSLQNSKKKTLSKSSTDTAVVSKTKQPSAPSSKDPLAEQCDKIAQEVNLFFITATEPDELFTKLQQLKQHASLQEYSEVSIRAQVLLAEYYQVKGHHLTRSEHANKATITFFNAALTHFKIAHSELDIFSKDSDFYIKYSDLITLCIDKQTQLLEGAQKFYETQVKKTVTKIAEVESDILKLEQHRDYLKYQVYGESNWKKNKGASPATKRRLHLEDEFLKLYTKDYPEADHYLLSIVHLIKLHKHYLKSCPKLPRSNFYYSFEEPQKVTKSSYAMLASTLAATAQSTMSSAATTLTTSSTVVAAKNHSLLKRAPAPSSNKEPAAASEDTHSMLAKP